MKKQNLKKTIKKSTKDKNNRGPGLGQRKTEHIELAFQSQLAKSLLDGRFFYEPMLSAHPPCLTEVTEAKDNLSLNFLGKVFKAPLWISSMTGGAKEAKTINTNLAQAAREFGLGMGLGSCRILLDELTGKKTYSRKLWKDFHLRPILGDDRPFFANLGLAQVEQALLSGQRQIQKIHDLIHSLEADGLIIHVNPLQEWLQPEGDRFTRPPLETLQNFLEKARYQVIVKEVGQGMGPQSLKHLLQLPLAALEFSSFGGTNFSRVELLRGSSQRRKNFEELAYVGHSAEEMVIFVQQSLRELKDQVRCKEFIISGGIQSFLDGHYLMNKLGCHSIYGQGKTFLEHSRSSYEDLRTFILHQVEGLAFAKNYLWVRPGGN